MPVRKLDADGVLRNCLPKGTCVDLRGWDLIDFYKAARNAGFLFSPTVDDIALYYKNFKLITSGDSPYLEFEDLGWKIELKPTESDDIDEKLIVRELNGTTYYHEQAALVERLSVRNWRQDFFPAFNANESDFITCEVSQNAIAHLPSGEIRVHGCLIARILECGSEFFSDSQSMRISGKLPSGATKHFLIFPELKGEDRARVTHGLIIDGHKLEVDKVDSKEVIVKTLMDIFILGLKDNRFSLRGGPATTVTDLAKYAKEKGITIKPELKDFVNFSNDFVLKNSDANFSDDFVLKNSGVPILRTELLTWSVKVRPLDTASNWLYKDDTSVYYVPGMDREDERTVRELLQVHL